MGLFNQAKESAGATAPHGASQPFEALRVLAGVWRDYKSAEEAYKSERDNVMPDIIAEWASKAPETPGARYPTLRCDGMRADPRRRGSNRPLSDVDCAALQSAGIEPVEVETGAPAGFVLSPAAMADSKTRKRLERALARIQAPDGSPCIVYQASTVKVSRIVPPDVMARIAGAAVNAEARAALISIASSVTIKADSKRGSK